MKGVVIQTYGAGHFPSSQPLLGKVKEACERGVVVVNCSQCAHGNTHTPQRVYIHIHTVMQQIYYCTLLGNPNHKYYICHCTLHAR